MTRRAYIYVLVGAALGAIIGRLLAHAIVRVVLVLTS